MNDAMNKPFMPRPPKIRRPAYITKNCVVCKEDFRILVSQSRAVACPGECQRKQRLKTRKSYNENKRKKSSSARKGKYNLKHERYVSP